MQKITKFRLIITIICLNTILNQISNQLHANGVQALQNQQQHKLPSNHHRNSKQNNALIQSTLQYFSGLEMRQLLIEGSQTEDALLQLIHSPNNVLTIGLLAEYGTLVINNGRINIIECKPGVFKIGAITSQFKSISITSGDLIFNDIPQWKLVVQEEFWSKPNGWTDNSISSCGGVHMLGGFGKFAGGVEIKKIFNDLPKPHSFLRILATFHFIDAWSGETAFMRINTGKNGDMEYAWTSKYDFSKSVQGINVCGADYPEGRFTSLIDVSLRHNDDKVVIGFGSTLDQDPYENSFGVSNIQIYLK